MELEIEPLDYAGQLALAELVGYPGQSRLRWQQAITAASIVAIDGREVFPVTHPEHIRDLMKQVPIDKFREANIKVHTYRAPLDEGTRPDITVEPLSTLEIWDMSDFAGGFYDVAAWNGLATVACSVRTLNGKKLEFPHDLPAVRDRVKLLGWTGMDIAADLLAAKRQKQSVVPEPAPGN